MLDEAVFEVAAFFHSLPDYIWERPAAWVLEQFRRVVRHRRREMVALITCTEVGVVRALIPLVSGKPVPPLRLEIETPRAPEVPAWIRKYEAANRTVVRMAR